MFNTLLQMVPGPEEHLFTGETSEAAEITKLVLNYFDSMRPSTD